jgi:predicted Rossmann fold flavoprotein
VLVIGGGAAGSLAAIAAAEAGAPVQILEKMPRLGAKLLISGKGRCNLTNRASLAAFLDAFGETGPFLRNVFHRFFVDDLCRLFEEQGLELVTERGGRVFPAAGEAPAVVEALARRIEALGIQVRADAPVEEIVTEAQAVRGVRLHGAGPEAVIPARAVVLATGGASYPQTGSTGDGYRIAAALGHRVVTPRAALVPLLLAEPVPAEWRQVTLRHVAVTLCADGESIAERFGEAFFVRGGIGGPSVLSLSRRAGVALATGRRVEIVLNLKPALSPEKLDGRLQRELAAHGGPGGARAILKALLPRKLIPGFLARWGVDPEQRGSEISRAQRGRLRALLQDLRFTVRGLRPLAEAIVTAGGLATDEIDPRTLASRRIAGLFIAGEVLDIDAETGGFNLQAAFSTGWVAGASAGAYAAAVRQGESS